MPVLKPVGGQENGSTERQST